MKVLFISINISVNCEHYYLQKLTIDKRIASSIIETDRYFIVVQSSYKGDIKIGPGFIRAAFVIGNYVSR